jgi:hypothetical protein
MLVIDAATPLFAQQIPKSNFTIFHELTRSIFADSMFASALQPEFPLVVRVNQSQDSWIVKQIMTESLTQRGYQVYFDSIQEGMEYVSIFILSSQLSVVYGESFQQGLFTSRKIPRQCSVGINIEIVQVPSNIVLLSKHFSQTSLDTLDVSMISTVEQSDIPSTRGQLPNGSLLNRIAEPMVVIGAVGIVMILFFTIRS